MSFSQSIGSIAKHLALLFEDLNNDVQNFGSSNYTINTSHLDEKILKLESKFSEIGLLVQCAITNARRRRNALAPIHRLPAELLQGIFQICASTAHESELSPSNIHKDYMMLYPTWGRWRHPNGPNSVYSTMKMVAVCSHWQQLALSTPRLWCYLDSRHSLGLTQVLLERSKFAPLQISCLHGVDPHHEQGFMRLVTPHLDRWISFNSASVNEMLFKNISDYNRSSLLLERFIIHLAERGIVVPSFVLERSPRLRELHIAQTRCPTEIMGLSGLTNLSLNGFIGEKQFQMEQYQTIFSMNPRLETIFLNGPSYSNEDYSPIIINLHKLKTIVLYRVKPGLTAALLLSISPGQGNYPSIQVIGDLNVSPQLSNRTIKGSLKDMLEENMSWLSVVVRSEDKIVPLIRAGMECCGVQVTLLEIQPTNIHSIVHMAMALVDDGSSSGLRSLEIQSRYKTNSFYIASKLHLYSNLKHLTIIAFEDEIGSHIEALCFPPAELTPSGSQLPLLTTLAIKGLPSLHRVFKVVVDARYGPSRKKLLESDLCKKLKTLKVYTSTGADETLIKSIKSFLAMREVVLELIVVGDRT